MDITFSLPHVFNGHGNDRTNAVALEILLKCLVRLNLAYLRSAPGTPGLYSMGVRYWRPPPHPTAREKAFGRLWQTIPEMMKTKKADCKSLTGALVAEYLNKGIKCKPVFRFKKRADGSTLYHILVMVPGENGYEKTLWEDPSKKLGMGNEWEPLYV